MTCRAPGGAAASEPQKSRCSFFCKRSTAYEIYQCDWSSDVCSSDLNQAVMTSAVASCAFDRSCPIEVSGCTWSAAEATVPILERASLSAACFHRLSSPSVNLASSLSTRLPQLWQSQIALSACLRSSGVSAGSYLGPPGDAAVIWASTPMLIAFVESAFGPVVWARH